MNYNHWMNQMKKVYPRHLPRIWHTPCLLLVALCSISPSTFAAPAAKPASYMRTVNVDENVMRLDMAARTFVPIKGNGPTITLVAAIHIGDKDFYNLAQLWLDAQDLVLFEGVGDEHMRMDPDSDAYRIEKTRRSIRHTAIMLERYKRLKKQYPATLAELVSTVAEYDAIKGARLQRATKDGWSQPLRYKVSNGAFKLFSLGADNKRGGKKTNQDLHLTDQKALTKQEIDPQGKTGIQADMAAALGLAFQLHAFDTGKPNYKNSDLTVDQLKQRMAKSGADLKPLMGMMDGSSMLAGLLKVGLGFIRSNPRMQTMVKIMLMETLSQYGDDIGKMKGVPASMQTMLKVLIEDRNQAVMDDLKKELAKKKPAGSIGVWYGAGHMRDLEIRMREQLKYRPAGQFWLPAITIDLNQAGISKQELEGMRKMLMQLN